MVKAVTFDLDGVYFTPQSFKNFKINLPKKVTDEDKVNWVLYKIAKEFAMWQEILSRVGFMTLVRQSLVFGRDMVA